MRKYFFIFLFFLLIAAGAFGVSYQSYTAYSGDHANVYIRFPKDNTQNYSSGYNFYINSISKFNVWVDDLDWVFPNHGEKMAKIFINNVYQSSVVYGESSRDYGIAGSNKYSIRVEYWQYEVVRWEWVVIPISEWVHKRSLTVNLYHDKTAPSITYSGNNNGQWSNNNLNLRAAAADETNGSGVNTGSWQYSLNGGSSFSGISQNSSSITYNATGEWDGIIRFRVKDSLQNTRDKDVPVKIDKTIPVISSVISSGEKNVWQDVSSVTVTASAVDPVPSGVNRVSGIDSAAWQYSYTKYGSPNAPVTGTGSQLALTQEGEWFVYFDVKDNAGNAAVRHSSIVKIDRTPPVVNIDERGANKWINGDRFYAVAAPVDFYSGLAAVEYSLDDAAYQPAEFLASRYVGPTLLEEGEYTVAFKATDNLGHVAVEEIEVKIDRTPPVINAQGCVEWSNDSSIFAFATASADGAPVDFDTWQYKINDGPWSSESADNNIVEIFQEGNTLVFFRVKDLAGNVAEEVCAVKSDRTGPVIIASGSGGWVNTASYTAFAALVEEDVLSGIDSDSWEYSVNGGSWNSGSTVTITEEGIGIIRFRVKDIAGNFSEIAQTTVMLDSSLPEMSATDTPWISAVSANINISINDFVSGIDEDSLFYSRDESRWLPVTDFTREGSLYNLNITTEELFEGINTLYIRVYDYAANSLVIPVNVKLDTQPPVINQVRLFSGETEVSDVPYIFTEEIAVRVFGSDTSGISGTKYVLYPEKESNPLLTTFADGSSFDMNITKTGTYYLYIKLVDLAGNESEIVWEEKIDVDITVPGTPLLESLSHPLAQTPEDAVALTDAVFRASPSDIIPPGPAGINGYSYDLKAGMDAGTGTLISSGSSIDGRIEINNLADNNPGEFYFLEVVCEGSNGLTSTNSAVYSIRIDQTPPANLKISSSSHPNPGVYYNAPTGIINWNRPADYTGIKTYYYKVALSSVTDSEADLSQWSLTTETSLTIDLETAASAPAGELFVGVVAEDYSGNRQFSSFSLRFDTLKPELPGEMEIHTNSDTGELVVSWPEPSDNVVGGVARVELKLIKQSTGEDFEDITNWQVKTNSDYRELVYKDLDTDLSIVYGILMKVIDRAGNEQSYAKGFNFSGAPLDIVFAVPFKENIMGFTVKGSYSSDPALQEVILELPGSLEFKQEELGLTELKFENYSFDGDGSFLSASAPGLSYDVSLSGMSFSGEGLTFSVSEGLVFAELSLLKEVEPDVLLDFTYSNVSVAPPPALYFEETLESREFPFNFQSNIVSGKENLPGFGFTDISTTALKEQYWFLKDGKVDFSPVSHLINAYKLNEADEKIYTISITDAAITSGGELFEGFITENYFLNAANLHFQVEESVVRSNKLVVLKAKMILDDGLTSDDIIVENFSINMDGLIQEEEGFTSSSFTFTVDGVTYDVAGVNILSSRFVITDGDVNYSATTSYSVSGLVLNSDGVTYELPGEIAAYEGNLFGFPVFAYAGQMQNGEILFENLFITLPDAFTLEDQILHNVKINPVDNSVMDEGTGAAAFVFDTAYGKPVRVNSLAIDSSGLYAAQAMLPLPDNIIIDVNEIEIRDLPLYPDGTTGSSVPYGDLAFGMMDYTFYSNDIRFDGQKLMFGNTYYSLSENFEPREAVFEGFALNSAGEVMAEGTSAYSIDVKDMGWHYYLNNLILDASGIHGSAEIQLPGSFGYRVLNFQDFRLFPEGTYSTGSAVAGEYIRLFGWTVKTSNITLAEGQINIGQAAVQLHAGMGWGELVVPDVILDMNGNLISSGTGTDSSEFTSTTGFDVITSAYTFKDDGLYLGGKLFFPQSLGSSSFALYNDTEIKLESDGAVITQPASRAAYYKLAGWDVKAEEYYFNRDGVFVKYNTITLPYGGVDLLVEDVRFYADGEVKVGGHAFEGFEFSPFDGPVSVGVTDISLNDEGVNVKAFITLPPSMGEDAVIYFDQLTLHPDGSITSDVAVSHLNFDVGKVNFDFSTIILDRDGFVIDKAVITLPEELDSKRISIKDLRITNTGEFILGGLSVDPFTLWGYAFYIDDIGFKDDVISFEGGLRFPGEFFIDELAGKRVDIDIFKVNLDGDVLDFSVSINDTLSFKLFEKYNLDITNVSINKEEFRIESGVLELPEEIGVESASVSNIVINMQTMSVDVGGVTITGFGFEFEGLFFDVDTLTLSSARGMEFKGSVLMPQDFPINIGSNRLIVDMFQVTPEFTIGDIDARIEDINAPLLDGTFDLKNGLIGFSKIGDHMTFNIGGTLLMGAKYPEWIAGKGASINEFTIEIDPETGFAITAFDAVSTPLNIPVFGLVDVEDAVIHIKLNQDTGITTVAVSGPDASTPAAVVLTNPGFPETIRGERIEIYAFQFNSNGDLEEFDAALTLGGERKVFGDLWLIDKTERRAKISAALNETKTAVDFGITGTLRFGTEFPEGLAGIETAIDALSFDSLGRLTALDIGVAFPEEYTLFETLTIKNGRIELEKEADDTIWIRTMGTILPPEGLPEGFEDMPPLMINKFEISTTGEIGEVDMGVENINLTVFNVLDISNGSISARKGTGDEILLTFGSDLSLPESFGDKFTSLALTTDLEYSTTTGVNYFNTSLKDNEPVSIELFAGVVMGFNKIDINTEGIGFGGSLTFSDKFPEGLSGTTIVMKNFEMNWLGEITDIQAGIASATIELGGFTTDIENLIFTADGVELGSCMITLPEVLGSKVIGVQNALWDKTGDFQGEIVAPPLDFDIGGFRLVLETPSLNVNEGKLSFAKVMLLFPELVGGKGMSLDNVTISPAGLSFGGGQIRLPDFVIAGGLGFRDVGVDIAIDGDKYRIGGAGSILIPGAGMFTVSVAFVNKSADYPWGIEYAAFEYTIHGLGVPLGTTGLYLNAIRGSIAFGPPNELPQQIRWLFDNGTRLSMGLTIGDQSGGHVIKGDVDMWVDITNWSWAFRGRVTVLDGLASAEVVAAISKYGFYGEFNVRMVFAQGHVRVYVYKKNNRTRVSGSGEVKIGIVRGSILNYVQQILWWKVHIVVPPVTFWLPGINTEFGQFTNGSEGFKAYTDVPFFGRVGVFVPKRGGVVLGNVNRYVLEKPVNAGAGPRAFSSRTSSGNVAVRDIQAGNDSRDTYYFTVPERKSMASEEVLPGPVAYRSARTAAGSSGQDEAYGEEVERIIFAIGFEEGDPVIAAISPSGQRYMQGDPNVLIERTDWGIMLGVLNPEPGPWSVEVSNMISSDSYIIEVFGKTVTPELTLDTPAFNGEFPGEIFTFRGRAITPDGSAGKVIIYVSEEKNSLIGRPIAETLADPVTGEFVVEMDTNLLGDGEYFFFAGIESLSDAPEIKSIAPGFIIINRSGADTLDPVKNFIASDNGAGGIDISFEDVNGERTKGFKLTIENLSAGETESIWLGYLVNTTIPGFKANEKIGLSITPVDDHNKDGEISSQVIVNMGEEKPEVNVFEIIDLPDTINLSINHSYAGGLSWRTLSPVITGSALDYMEAEILEAPAKLYMGFDDLLWNLTEQEGSATYTLLASADMAPGDYPIKLAFRNRGNKALSREVTLNIRLEYPAVSIKEVTPIRWNNMDEQSVDIVGENFLPGTRVSLNGEELIINELAVRYMNVTVPAGAASGMGTLKIIGPGQDETGFNVTINEPHYMVDGIKTYVAVTAGKEGSFIFTIQNKERFSGIALFELEPTVSGILADMDKTAIAEGETVILSVKTDPQLETGQYPITVVSDRGDRMVCLLDVTATPPAPIISSLSKVMAIAGEHVTIYGYGFGEQGKVYLNGIQQQTESYTEDKIEFILGASAVGGTLKVVRDTLESNGYTFYVKEKGFSLYPAVETVNLQAGDTTKSLSIYVTGYAEAVELEFTASDEFIKLTPASTTVIPNGAVELTINIEENVPNGNYTIYVTGKSGEYIRGIEIPVIMGDAFEIITETLPGGMTETEYNGKVESENHTGSVTFMLMSGRLPGGITLQRDGTLTGRPTEGATRTFTIEAEDEAGRKAVKTLSITVEENTWALSGKDSGGSKYNPVKAPGDERTLWSVETAEEAKEIITGKDRVFVLTAEEIYGLHNTTGTKIFRYPGNFVQWGYVSGSLCLLDDKGVFHMIDSLFGNLRWTRENVTAFTLNGSILLLGENGMTAAIDITDGTLAERTHDSFTQSSNLVWAGNRLLEWQDSSLYLLEDGNRSIQFTASGIIVEAVISGLSIAILTETGTLTLLSQDFSPLLTLDTGMVGKELVLGETKVIITDGITIEAYNKEDGSKIFSTQTSNKVIGAGKEKIFTAGESALKAINGYTGREIWSLGGSFVDLAIAGEKLYALDDTGQVYCFNGPDNVAPPVTEVKTYPASPDGKNGYFVTLPVVELEAYDPETFVTGIWYRYGTMDYKDYTESLELPEGRYSFLTYSADTEGYREKENLYSFSVDITNPVTSMDISSEPNVKGYHTEPVKIVLSANDNLSGVEKIEYSVSDEQWYTYTGSLYFTKEEEFLFRCRAVDFAGNIEETHSREIKIDLEDPIAAAKLWEDNGISVVYLEASDTASGVETIEYFADNSYYSRYRAPIAFTTEGIHSLRYRAIDIAGRDSGWKIMDIVTPAYDRGDWIGDVQFTTQAPGREIIRNITAGEALYSPSKGKNNTINNLPDYLEGADYIRLHNGDKKENAPDFIRFKAEADIHLFVMKHKLSSADFSGWELVEENFPVESSKYFKGGADIYRKDFRKGETVSIPGSDTKKGYPNLIFVQYALSNYVKIISPTPDTELLPGQEIQYAGAAINLEYSSCRWSYKIDEASWISLGESAFGQLAVPYVDKTSLLYLNLTLLDEEGRIITETSTIYSIINEARIELLDPAPGTEVLLGEPISFSSVVYDTRGSLIEAAEPDWFFSLDQVNWNIIDSDFFYTPQEAGPLYLKFQWNETFSFFTLSVIEQYTPVRIDFTEDAAVVAGTRQDGKYYGFSDDHRDLVGSYIVKDKDKGKGKNKDREKGKEDFYITLKPGAYFEYSGGNGTFTVKLTFAPFIKGASHEVFIENTHIILTEKKGDKLVEKTITLDVTDHRLTVAGSPYLPLSEIEILKK